MAEDFGDIRPQEYHSQLISKEQRADGRKLEEVREVKLEVDAIRTADSSSLVKLGNTSLVCGCTTQILKASDKVDDTDEIKIKVDLPPICSSHTGHRTQYSAQLLTKTLRDILESSNCVDRQSLYIQESDSYWSVNVEVICLNLDGCLLDAALLAVLAALKSLKLRCKATKEGRTSTVTFNSFPICSSFAVFGDRIVCDPNLEEETAAHSTISVAIDLTTLQCCHINKIGGKALTPDDLFKCIELAKKRANQLRQLIEDLGADRMECSPPS